MMQRLNTTKRLLLTLTLFLFVQTVSPAKDKPAATIKQTIILDVDINKAWQILGPEFPDAYKWAASVNHSVANDHNSVNGSTCSERGCNISGFGEVKEKVLEYSDAEHILVYEVTEGLPSMVKYMANRWELTDLGNGKTKLVMQMEMKTGGMMGAMMKGMMKKKMTKMSAEVVEEFKYFVETGSPHARKVKAAEKFSKKSK
ncbi:MAG: SRPBCC family protein [Cyclobacteriaceae bacterium]|nr:SRPBCC family protein [Cyclobacteriaceae bacterium]